jgi:N utilization substance protein A
MDSHKIKLLAEKSNIDYDYLLSILTKKFDLNNLSPENKREMLDEIRKIRIKNNSEYINEIAGTIVHGLIQGNATQSNYTVLLENNFEAFLPKYECIKGDNFLHNDKVLAFVVQSQNNATITLSRTHPKFLEKLIAKYVPEVESGEIIIKKIVREPGSRAKIAVYSENKKLNVFGAIIGHKLSRIKKIRENINNEEIDIVKYTENKKEYVASALAPAGTIRVDEIGENQYRAFVSKYQLSLAIGTNAQNVRLAARLTGLKIDIKDE